MPLKLERLFGKKAPDMQALHGILEVSGWLLFFLVDRNILQNDGLFPPRNVQQAVHNRAFSVFLSPYFFRSRSTRAVVECAMTDFLFCVVEAGLKTG